MYPGIQFGTVLGADAAGNFVIEPHCFVSLNDRESIQALR